MPVQEQKQSTDRWLKFEGEREYSRDVVSLGPGTVETTLPTGTVLGSDTAAGILPIDFDSTSGGSTPSGVLYGETDMMTAAAVDAVSITRHALVIPENMVWPADATEEQKAAALAVLKEKGIVDRTEA